MFTARNAKLFSFQRATGQRKLAAHHRIRLSRDRRNWGLSELHIGSIDCLHRLHRKVDHNWHAIHIVERFLPMYGKFKGIRTAMGRRPQPGVPHWETKSVGNDGCRKSAAGSTCTWNGPRWTTDQASPDVNQCLLWDSMGISCGSNGI